MNRRLLPLAMGAALAIIPAVASTPGPAAAEHTWGGFHWSRATNPVTVELGDNVSSAWDPYLAEAARDWDPSAEIVTRVGRGRARGGATMCGPIAGRVEVCNARYGENGWMGLAQVWIDGTHITQGTVKLNDTYFSMPGYNTPAWRRLVMCQEIGHTFGLGHTNEIFDNPNDGTCMDYTADPDGGRSFPGGLPDPSNEHPNGHDHAQLTSQYTHLDPATTTTSSTRNAGGQTLPDQASEQAGGNTPAEWGAAVRHGANGRPLVFRRDLGAGRAVLTWVRWADSLPVPGDGHDHIH